MRPAAPARCAPVARRCACSARAAPRRTAIARSLPGLRASADAEALAEEIAFVQRPAAGARGGATRPVRGGRARWPQEDIERATWIVLPDRLPVAARGRGPVRRHPPARGARPTSRRVSRSSLADLERSPARSPHLPRSRAVERARCWPTAMGRARRRAAAAFAGEAMEPGAALRAGASNAWRCRASGAWARYELLVTLGRLGRCTSCAPTRCTRRARELTRASERRHLWPPSASSRSAIRCCSTVVRTRSPSRDRVPIEALDLALSTGAPARGERATLGFRAESSRSTTRSERCREAL